MKYFQEELKEELDFLYLNQMFSENCSNYMKDFILDQGYAYELDDCIIVSSLGEIELGFETIDAVAGEEF